MIIVFAGKRGSGKSTAAKYVSGLVLKELRLISEFRIEGVDLVVKGKVRYQNETKEEEYPFDLKRRDYEFLRFAHHKIYPYVKIFSFADPLKEFLHKMFGVSYECLYGTDQQKNEPTKVLWDNVLKLLPTSSRKQFTHRKGEYVTVRELMQVFGTDILRTLYEDCHVDACFDNIYNDSPELALIDDCRFPNEVYRSKHNGAKVIKLSNKIEEGTHESETALDNLPDSEFDYVVPECDLNEKHRHLHIALTQFGLGHLCQ